MKLGAERKKVIWLAILMGVAGVLFYTNVLSQPSGPPADSGTRASAPAAAPTPEAQPASTAQAQKQTGPSIRRAGSRSRNNEDFHPSLKPGRPEDRPDPSTIDPTLRLDLLAKLQKIEPQGGARNLFQFSAPPAPPLKGEEPKIAVKKPKLIGPEPPPPPPTTAAKATPPPPPPINLKYYGFSSVRGSGKKTAFFLDGEDILVAAEGDTVKRRYKVVRIGVNSVVMEDTESKSQQTLPLQAEEATG